MTAACDHHRVIPPRPPVPPKRKESNPLQRPDDVLHVQTHAIIFGCTLASMLHILPGHAAIRSMVPPSFLCLCRTWHQLKVKHASFLRHHSKKVRVASGQYKSDKSWCERAHHLPCNRISFCLMSTDNTSITRQRATTIADTAPRVDDTEENFDQVQPKTPRISILAYVLHEEALFPATTLAHHPPSTTPSVYRVPISAPSLIQKDVLRLLVYAANDWKYLKRKSFIHFLPCGVYIPVSSSSLRTFVRAMRRSGQVPGSAEG